MRRGRAVAARLLALASLVAAGCGEEGTFTVGRDLDPCLGEIPTACSVQARCVLDGEHYLEGEFPGARRFVVRTDGEAELQFRLLLVDRKSPGTELRLVVNEPTCGESYLFDSAGRDLFRLTGSDGVLVIPITVLRGGDHLVEVYSDAYCSYLLRVDGNTLEGRN